MIRALSAVAVIAAPRAAWACAVCLDSAFGDRGFNWAFVALMLTPFAVAAALAGVLVRLRAPALPAQPLGEVSEGATEAPSEVTEAPSC